MLTTLLVVAKGIINNHPITAISSDPRDIEQLTPNHLLMHCPVTALPGLFNEDDLKRSKKWHQVEYLADVFWRRWMREYLPLLRQRTKWQDPQRNVQEGDLVLVLDHHAAGLQPMARGKGAGHEGGNRWASYAQLECVYEGTRSCAPSPSLACWKRCCANSHRTSTDTTLDI